MKVMIAYDGSERSNAAIEDLRRAGLGNDVEAELMFVADVWIPPENMYSGPSLWEVAIRDVATQGRNTLARASQEVQRAAERLRALFPQWKVTAQTTTGPAALRLVERAEGLPADLVLVGAQGHAVVERLGLGSVALKLVTHLQRSVRVSRIAHGTHPMRIVIGVDGSPDAQAALEAVAARHWPVGTEARALTVVDHRVLTVPDGVYLASDAAVSEISEAIANSAADRLRQVGLAASAHTVNGDPKHALIQAARDWTADCVFVGARGLTRVERFLLGSVSTSVAMHAPCSVEVVHPIQKA